MLTLPGWQAHPQVQTMKEAIAFAKQFAPRLGLYENVMGFGYAAANQVSALSYCQSELKANGFTSTYVTSCLSTWHAVLRTRTTPEKTKVLKDLDSALNVLSGVFHEREVKVSLALVTFGLVNLVTT